METILKAISFLTANVDTIKEMISTISGAFIVLVGSIWTAFTFLTIGWDKIFGGSAGSSLLGKVGLFLRRFSLLKDDPKA